MKLPDEDRALVREIAETLDAKVVKVTFMAAKAEEGVMERLGKLWRKPAGAKGAALTEGTLRVGGPVIHIGIFKVEKRPDHPNDHDFEIRTLEGGVR